MPRLIAITGSPGSGKTPLLHELRARGYPVVEEPARAVLAEQRASGGSGVPGQDLPLFLKLMLERGAADHERMSAADGIVFFDRGIVDLIGYAKLFGLDPAGAERLAEAHPYDPMVFILPSWEEIYTKDDDRKMEFEFAARFGDLIRSDYERLGYDLVDVPKETIAARADRIVRLVSDGDDVGR